MALMVIMLVGNFNAEAQFGISIGGIGGGSSSAKAEIPKPKKKGKPVTFASGHKVELGIWNPVSLDLILYKGVAEESQVVYRIDPNTGAITSGDGSSKGSMNNNGNIVTPNNRTLTVKKKDATDFEVLENGQVIGTVVVSNAYEGGVWSSIKGNVTVTFPETISPMVVAYIAYGVLPDKKYTADALDDLVEWIDQESVNQIIKYETSLPCAGFKDIAPELKNCKVAAVGLQDKSWIEFSHKGNDGFTHWDYRMDYWVVYELTDGRNLVTFCTAVKESKYGDVTSKFKRNGEFFHEVTDWQRK